MTLEEFISTDPGTYGSSNINLFYSSSISGSSTPIPPYTIKGMSIQFTTGNGLDISSALKNVDSLKFDFGNEQVTAPIAGKRKQTGYFYFSIEPFNTDTLPTSIDPAGNVIEQNSEFVFVPYIQQSFNNNDYNPLINNSEDSKRNVTIQQVDRTTSQANPTNLQAIITNNATPAESQDSAYSTIGLISSKYLGTKTSPAGPVYRTNKDEYRAYVEANAVEGNTPAASYKGFEGSQYTDDASTATLKDIGLSDRDIQTIYFDAQLTGTHPNKTYPNFPNLGSFIFTEDSNQLVRAVNSKIYSIDKGEVYTTDEFGKVILVE